MNREKKLRDKIFLLIRLLLIVSIITSSIASLLIVFNGDHVAKPELVNEVSKQVEFIFWGIITLVLTFGPGYIERKNRVDIPDILEIIIIVFIYAGLFLSVRFNLYYSFFWWDDLLHAISGIIIGFIGSIVIYKLNQNYTMDISPLLIAVFSFVFAVTIGVMWEILEFVSDVFIGTANQKWNLPDTEIMMGKPYQGSGLRDTMSDLIINSVGAFITSLITYYMYRKKLRRCD